MTTFISTVECNDGIFIIVKENGKTYIEILEGKYDYDAIIVAIREINEEKRNYVSYRTDTQYELDFDYGDERNVKTLSLVMKKDLTLSSICVIL